MPREFLGATPAVQIGPVSLRHGTGAPEGAVTGSVGDLYMRTDGGTSTTLYVKETGSGNTGWVAAGAGGGSTPTAQSFSMGATITSPAAGFFMVWRAPFGCTVTNVRGHRKGGTGATVNARKNQTSDHLASDLSLTSADTWMTGGTPQNTTYAAGDDLEIEIASVAGTPTEIDVQVDFTVDVVGGGSATAETLAMAARAPFYPWDLCGGDADDDEFADGSFTGWTAVQDSAPVLTLVEADDRLSILHPGGDAAAEIHAWVKARTVSSGDFIEACFRVMAYGGAYIQFGLLFANGATYGAGSQMIMCHSPTENGFVRSKHTNYSSSSGAAIAVALPDEHVAPGRIFMRYRYSSTNVYTLYTSVDGKQWFQIHTETDAHLSSRTHMGFYVSTWGGANPMMHAVDYVRFGNV